MRDRCTTILRQNQRRRVLGLVTEGELLKSLFATDLSVVALLLSAASQKLTAQLLSFLLVGVLLIQHIPLLF